MNIITQLFILFLIFTNACPAQTVENLFHGAIRDKAGNLWFASTKSGLYRYDALSSKFTNFTMKDGLPTNDISSVVEDRAGNLWINTNNGVCRYDDQGKTFSNFSLKDKGCPFDISLLSEDRKGNLWFGTNGYGICRYNPRSGLATNFTKEEGLGSNYIQCMLEDKAGNIWIGERAGGVSRFDSATGMFTRIIKDCFSSQIMGIIEDRNGNIWFANLYDGLCRYEPVTCKFTHFTEADGLCQNVVTCICEDRKGNLWLGSDAGNWNTGGGGVCRYSVGEQEGKSSTRFTGKDGITSMNVWTIVEDNDGNIWVGTKGGLYRYHSPSGRFVDYTFKLNSGSY